MSAKSRIVTISVATAVLYLANDWTQRAISQGAPLAASVFADVRAASAPTRLLHDWKALVFVAVTVCLFICYAAVLTMCRRGEFADRDARAWALVVPWVVNVLLLLSPPTLSEDLYSYMAHGFLGLTPHGNPLLQPASEVGLSEFGSTLASFGWHGLVPVTPYGILWTRIEMLIMRLSGAQIPMALILFKTVAVAASMASAWLIYSTLGRISPSTQVFGALLYSWNPLVVVEFAGEGHNDSIMVFFVLLALGACVSRRGASSMVALALGILTKYFPVLFVPPQFVYLWRTRRNTLRLALEALAVLAILAAVAAVLYEPVWAGRRTFDGLIQRGIPVSSASPPGVVNWILRRSSLASHSAGIVVAFTTLPILAFVAWISMRVRDAAGLAKSFAWISIAYVLFASPDYWPWYSCMPIALIAVSNADRLWWLAAFMSLAGRLCSPLNLWYDEGFLTYVVAKGVSTAFGTTVPLIITMAWVYIQRRRSSGRFA